MITMTTVLCRKSKQNNSCHRYTLLIGSIIAAATAIVAGTFAGARPALAQTLSAEDFARRTIERRAIEAINWGMSAVNFECLYESMRNRWRAWSLRATRFVLPGVWNYSSQKA